MTDDGKLDNCAPASESNAQKRFHQSPLNKTEHLFPGLLLRRRSAKQNNIFVDAGDYMF